MDFPPQVINDVQSVVAYGEAYLGGKLTDLGVGFVLSLIRRGLVKTVPSLKHADPREIEIRLNRVESAMNSMAEELEAMREAEKGKPIEEESVEPRARRFIEEAFAASMESPSEDKRDLLGRLVARRLYVKSESTEELTMREALTVAEKLNDEYLRVLATLSLIHGPPTPVHQVTRGELYRWWDARLLPVLIALDVREPNYGELEHLVFVGAATLSERVEEELYSGLTSEADSIEQAAIQATGEYYSNGAKITCDFYHRSHELLMGRYTKGMGKDLTPMGAFHPTPAGATIGALVIESVRRQLAVEDS